MPSKIMTSLVGMMMLIGTPSWAESGNSHTGTGAEPNAEASQNTDHEPVSDDELESSSADAAENSDVVGDIAVGEELYQDSCRNCHGPRARGMASFPKLTGHEAEYLVERLAAYRAGEKVGPNTALMAPVAADLTDEDIASLALYITEAFE